ncbi:hypothetical protein TNCV_52271 [Trichonephila clavipes]|nr:hypothetical protein TNCV_52271 [Trichonephila clavipes]
MACPVTRPLANRARLGRYRKVTYKPSRIIVELIAQLQRLWPDFPQEVIGDLIDSAHVSACKATRGSIGNRFEFFHRERASQLNSTPL